jgi:hypothetical protein
LIGILPATTAIILMGQQFLDWWEGYSTYIIIFAIAAVFFQVTWAKRTSKHKV